MQLVDACKQHDPCQKLPVIESLKGEAQVCKKINSNIEFAIFLYCPL